MRLGQKNSVVRQWARTGTRPRQPKDQRYRNAWLFGAICPARDTGAAIVMPTANTEAMQHHLDEIARAVEPGSHAVVLLDGASWHTTEALRVPDTISLMPLPPYAPELNPTENVWQYLRQTWLSNRVFDTYEDILAAACNAWNRLIDSPGRIASIGHREWATNGLNQRPLV